jgi:hypothetical protein
MKGLSMLVVRALPRGRFEVDYRSPLPMPRAEARELAERMQDDFDSACEPLRAYICRDGIPIEAAHCLRSRRD